MALIMHIWQGCVKCSATGNFLLTEKLGEVRGMMEAYGVKPNRRTFALQIEACLKEQELEARFSSIRSLQLCHTLDWLVHEGRIRKLCEIRYASTHQRNIAFVEMS